jgi:putative oxidoreductase
MRAAFAPVALALLRVVAAFMFFQLGAQKVFGAFGSQPAAPLTIGWMAGVLELFGSIAIAVGWFANPIAAMLAVDMLATYVFVHAAQGTFLPISRNRVTEEVAQLFTIAAFLAFSGAGKLSVDGAFGKGHLASLAKYDADALGIFRIMTGLMFLSHGLVKLFGIGGGDPEVFLSLRWFAGFLEFFGGAAIALGLFTAPVAFIVCGEMAFAYFMSHAPRGFWPVENIGMRSVLFCYTFLFFCTAGPGKFALDNALARGKGTRDPSSKARSAA